MTNARPSMTTRRDHIRGSEVRNEGTKMTTRIVTDENGVATDMIGRNATSERERKIMIEQWL
jgi:hypothetical protein